MGKLKCAFIVLLSCLFLVSCDAQAASERENSVCIASWNVQNLFDAKTDGTEYEEYTASSGWTQSAYEARLSNVGKVLGYLPDAESYVLVLNEIEGPNVVEDIIKLSYAQKMGLCWYACAGAPGAAIRTAVVSSIPISSACIHDAGASVRPILEVGFDTENGKLFILAVHFKSNVDGVDATAPLRLQAAMVVAQISRSLEAENPGCLVLVCGDMNEECRDGNCMGRTGSPPLKVSGGFATGSWYCFWLDESLALWPGGSYMYRDEWKSYDNILISRTGRDGSGWEYEECGVVFEGVLKTADSKPYAWSRNLLKGVSDHLPVWVKLSVPLP